MTINQHVPSYETCLKLRDAGFEMETLYCWVKNYETITIETKSSARESYRYEKSRIGLNLDFVAAPLLSELLEDFKLKEKALDMTNNPLFSYAQAYDSVSEYLKAKITSEYGMIEAVAQLWIEVFGKVAK